MTKVSVSMMQVRAAHRILKRGGGPSVHSGDRQKCHKRRIEQHMWVNSNKSQVRIGIYLSIPGDKDPQVVLLDR